MHKHLKRLPRAVRPSSVRNSFGIPFFQRLWDLTKRRDGIVVADMVEDMVADKKLASVELDMVAKFHNFDQISQFRPNFTI